MEIRISCNKLIKLDNLKNLKNIEINVLSYNLDKNELNGDVKVKGEYYQLDTELYSFNDELPFTVVFRNDKVVIKNINIENEDFDEKINEGVFVKFELVVNYSILEEINNDKDENVIEVPVEIEEEVDEVSNNNVINEMLVESEKITKEYTELLEQFLGVRNNEKTRDSNKVYLDNQATTFKNITIYYLDKENEIEMISKEKRISVNDIYKNNSDFEKTRRIIINE